MASTPFLSAHHPRAAFLQHGAGQQRVDVVVLGQQDRRAPGTFSRATREGTPAVEAISAVSLCVGIVASEQLGEKRQRPDRAHQVAG